MIRFINAGAGSGKTYALSQELASFLIDQGGQPSGVILTTFTKKSAEELKERVRLRLLQEGFADKAAEMANAMIGTVNAICSQLVEKYAFEIGLSPELSVMDEISTTVFFDQFIANAVPPEMFEQLNRACSLFGLFEGKEGFANAKDNLKPSWPFIVKQLASRFRAYNFNKENVEASKTQALEMASSFLLTDKNFSVEKIWTELEKTASRPLVEPLAAKDKDPVEAMERLRSSSNRTREPWSSFEKAGAGIANKTAKNNPWLAELTALCSRYHQTVEFANGYRQLITLLYDTAFALIDGYQDYKTERGLIDFADQELLFLQMLQKNKKVQKEIAETFSLVMVDEFQDSSPVQLAIFQTLNKLVKHSVWVGDPKQAIYGFRGSDPELFTSALAEAEKENPEGIGQLEYSYRSRPAIVEAVNTCFTGIFRGLIKPEHIALKPAEHLLSRDEEENGYNAPALQVEFYNDTNQPDYLSSLAVQVKALLKSDRRVFDPREDRFRKIRGGDIALLFRTNSVATDCADIFRDHGIPVTCEAGGLQKHAEILWISCLLRLVINENDSLAIAQLAILESSFGSVEEMFNARLDHLKETDAGKNWNKYSHTATTLSRQARLISCMPLVQAVRHIITASNLYLYCERWGNAGQRYANIDKAIERAVAYEEQCNTAGTAASFPGFLEHLGNCTDLPAVTSEDAVTLITAHRAKGLEWPVVYLVKLDMESDDSRILFNNIHVTRKGKRIKEKLPDGTSIIYLPWPFAGKKKVEKVCDELLPGRDQLNEQLGGFSKTKQEEDRLLYVAFTRARDYLVLPHYKKYSGCGIESGNRFQPSPLFTQAHWEEMRAAAGNGLASLPVEGHLVQVRSIPPFDNTAAAASLASKQPVFYTYNEMAGLKTYAPRFIAPSRSEMKSDAVMVKLLAYEHPAIPLTGLTADMYAVMGTAIHNAFAAWNADTPEKERLLVTGKLLNRMGIQGLIQPADLDTSFRQFHAFIAAQYRPLRQYKEIHLATIEENNGQVTAGIADLVLETEKGLILIDHKTFPGHFETMALNSGHEHYAGHYAAQLSHYKSMLSSATGKPVIATLLHYVVQGRIVEIVMDL